MAESSPRLSVITVTFNPGPGFDQTAASVLAQAAQADLEWLVIDGGSTDDTAARFKDWERRWPAGRVRWTSEPDEGIYDAMNKGVAQARGDYVLFMNAGDWFADPEACARLLAAAGGDPGDGSLPAADFVYGACEQIYPDGRRFVSPPRPWQEAWKHMPCSHQSLLNRRTCLVEEPFDLTYPVAADHEFVLRWVRRRARVRVLQETIAVVTLETYTYAQLWRGWNQKRRAAVRQSGRPLRAWCYHSAQMAWGTLKHLAKKILPALAGLLRRRAV